MRIVKSLLRIMLVTFVFIVWFAMIFFPVRSAFSQPLRLEAQVGVCDQGLAPDGTWYSSHYPTDIDKRTTCYSLGISQAPWKLRDWSLGWRAAYVDLGKIKADTQWSYLEQQPGVSGEHCDFKTHEGCRGRARITQKTHGITFGPLIERSWGNLTLGAEVGGFFYYGVFENHISPTPNPDSLPPDHVKYVKWGSRHLTGYYGGTVRYGYLFATGRVYGRVRADEEGCGGCTGLANGRVTQVTVGLQIPF